jgi:transcriptional regulator with XRE-family HTH domain
MPTINAQNLRVLRAQKRWSLDDLAERSNVDRGTISRIETGKNKDNRRNTVERLAAALGTEVEILTGPDISAPEPEWDSASKSQFNLRMGNDARNALTLVAARYNVKASHIVHLAPLLFLWAAEHSLKIRSKRLDELESGWEVVSSHGPFPHLHGRLTYNWMGEEVMHEERQSIASRDIFGLTIDDDAVHPDYEESEDNPMAQFIRGLVDSVEGLASFEHFSPFWDRPGYTLGREEALGLTGGDEEAADHIINGYAPLHAMPKNVRDAGPQQVARWAIERANETLDQIHKDLKIDLGTLLGSNGND